MSAEVLPEEHVGLAAHVTRRALRRPTEDDFAEARLALVKAAAEWNDGKRPCRWPTFAANRIRWDLLYRFQLARAHVEAREVALFLSSPYDEEAELERPEMAREDPEPPRAEARADAERLLGTLPAREAEALRARFGIGREPGEYARHVAARGLARLRRRAGR